MSIRWKCTSKGIRFLVLDENQQVIATSAFFRNEMWARVGFLNACDLSDSPVLLLGNQKDTSEATYIDRIIVTQGKVKKLRRFKYISYSKKVLLESTVFTSLDETKAAIQWVRSELQRYRSSLQSTHFPLVDSSNSVKQRRY